MQLVCRKLRTLLSTPPPGLWGDLNLVTDFVNRTHTASMSRQLPQRPLPLRMPQPCYNPMACPGVREALFNCRWLMRRLQGFASIKCDTVQDRPIDASRLMTFMATLSGAFTEGTELHIVLRSGAGP